MNGSTLASTTGWRKGVTLAAAGLAAVVLLTVSPARGADPAYDPFPRPAELRGDIDFWKRVFGEVPSSQALLHDNRYLSVVYEVVDIPASASARERGRLADKVRGRYRTILETLATGKRAGLTADEARVLALWPADVSNAELGAAAKRIRFQQGLADRYLAGLKRSGRWKGYIESQFAANGVPAGLSALPHVESSFNPEARSHVGAAGLWQFTSSTGRRFMEIDHVVDERRDPYRSSEAAAELLAYNYSILKSWPLAITAYNHGVAGMRRAVRTTGTDDFAVISREYQGRTFGFASRNFYLAFLAALEVEQNADQYFGPVIKDKPKSELVIAMPDYVPAAAVAGALGMSTSTLKSYNPALLGPVWDGSKHVPKGYRLRVPSSLVDKTAGEVLAAIPVGQRFASQTPDMYHKVQYGESLSVIAARYNTSVGRLMEINNLQSSNRIRAGQTLRLPYAGRAIPAGAETYTVRSGDTLGRIAASAGLSETELMSRNGLADRNRIYVGQVLYLRESAPAKQAPEPAEPTPAAIVAAAADTVVEQPVAAADEAPIEETPIEEMEAEPMAAPAERADSIPPTTASLADPSDYSVDERNTIEVQAAETLGHYAEWLGIKTQRLRDINGLGFGKPVVVGRRIKLDFGRVSADEFTNRRVAYHRDMQEAFFVQYRVVDTTEHKVRRGESVWELTHREYKVPEWLVRQYNPDLDFSRVRPGARIVFPRLERVEPNAESRQSVAEAS